MWDDWVIPDKMEPIEGYRVWRPIVDAEVWDGFAIKRSQTVLSSLAKRTIWSPTGTLRADCLGGKDHQAPKLQCRCGIWGLWTEEALDEVHDAETIRGKIKAWGQIIVAEKGFRAQYAKIVAFDATHPLAKTLTEIYNVPTFEPNTFTFSYRASYESILQKGVLALDKYIMKRIEGFKKEGYQVLAVNRYEIVYDSCIEYQIKLRRPK